MKLPKNFKPTKDDYIRQEKLIEKLLLKIQKINDLIREIELVLRNK